MRRESLICDVPQASVPMVSEDKCSAAYSGVNVEIGDSQVSREILNRPHHVRCARSVLESGGLTRVMETLGVLYWQTSWEIGQHIDPEPLANSLFILMNVPDGVLLASRVSEWSAADQTSPECTQEWTGTWPGSGTVSRELGPLSIWV